MRRSALLFRGELYEISGSATRGEREAEGQMGKTIGQCQRIQRRPVTSVPLWEELSKLDGEWKYFCESLVRWSRKTLLKSALVEDMSSFVACKLKSLAK